MKSGKRKAVWLLCLALSAGMLSGCGGKDETAKEQESAEQTVSAETAGGAASSEDGGSRSEVQEDGGESGGAGLKGLAAEDYVTLGKYKGVEVTVAAVEIEEGELAENTLAEFQSRVSAENVGILDRPIETGDTANIDYVGKRDGVAFSGGTASGYNLEIGSGTFIPGFEDGLIGVSPGETTDLNLTFPENYGNDLAGAEVVFTVTVNFIMPEMNDETVKGLGAAEYKSVADIERIQREALSEEAEAQFQSNAESAVMSAVIEGSTFQELPEELRSRYEESVRNDLTMTAYSYGMDAASYCAYFGYTVDELVNARVESLVQQLLVMQAVANQEGLNITDDRLDGLMEDYAKEAGLGGAEELLAYNDLEDYREYFMMQEVLDFLMENAHVTKK